MGVHHPSEKQPGFTFDLAEGGDAGAERTPNRNTKLDFRQVGYDEQSEFFEFSKGAWGQVR